MPSQNLEQIKVEENFIRDHLYDPNYETHEMSTNPYFNLIQLNKKVWEFICCKIVKLDKDSSLYFPNARTKLRKYIGNPWSEIEKQAKNNDIEKIFGENSDHVFIAGGAALSILLSVRCTDTDYFTTKEILPWDIKSTNVKVSKHVINFSPGYGGKNQLIKRLYKQPHEIVHSFDIDSCAILINKNGEIYTSKRFISALINGYNTVDFNYLSPSYEWRLIKYSHRGFSVKIEDLENSDDVQLMGSKSDHGNEYMPDYIWGYADIQDILSGSMLRALLINAKGLSRILLASFASRNKQTNKYIRNLSEAQASDYESEVVYTKNNINGKVVVNDKSYGLSGYIKMSEDGDNVYEGTINRKPEEDTLTFSEGLQNKILNILESGYKKVNPGEQATSTFNQIVLENPSVWYDVNIKELFVNALYTFLNFPNVTMVPSLYDDKVLWFGEDVLNEYVYHITRLIYNNVIYDKFGDFTLSTFRVSNNDVRPDVLSYDSNNIELEKGDTNNIIRALYESGKLPERDTLLLRKLYLRLQSSIDNGSVPKRGYSSYGNRPTYRIKNAIPKVEKRFSNSLDI